MSTNVGSIHYDLDLDKSKFSNAAQSVHSELESVGDKMVAFGKKAALAFGAAGVAATLFGVKSAADFEQTRIGLENMLGSADKAKKLLAQISDFAAKTPFEFPELAQAARQLVAFGFSADEAYNTMKNLGDVSAAVGTPINDLAYLMGTLRTQGRAFTIDIRQFAQRGIPIYEYLAKVLNINEQAITGMIEAGKIGFPEVQKAFQLMTAEGGKFHGAMEAQSKSLSGLFSTLKDNIGLALREFIGINQQGDVKEGSIFDRLRQGAAGLNAELAKINWAQVAANFMAFTGSVMQVVSAVVTYLQPGISNLINTLVYMTSVFLAWVMPSLNALWQTIQLRVLPKLMDLLGAIEPGFTTVLKILAIVLGVILIGAIWVFINGLNIALSVVGFVIRIVSDLISWIGNLVVWAWNAAGAIIGAFNSVRGGVAAALGYIIGIIKGLGSQAVGVITGFYGAFFEAGKHIISGLANGIKSAAGAAVDAAKGVVSDAVGAAKNLLKIHSPSGVFMDIGQNMARGMAIGMQSMSPQVSMASAGMAAQAIGGVTNNTNTSIGNVNVQNRSDADYLISQLMRDDQIASKGLTPTRNLYGG
jgi:hypothetical protein